MSPQLFRLVRVRLGLCQKEIAAEIGVSASALCQFEKGRENAIAPWRILPKADELTQRFREAHSNDTA